MLTSHSSRTNNSWLFAPSSLILANYHLPLNGALCVRHEFCLNCFLRFAFYKKVLCLLPVLCFGNLRGNYTFLAFGQSVFRQFTLGAKR
jgi:hypothetical protein